MSKPLVIVCAVLIVAMSVFCVSCVSTQYTLHAADGQQDMVLFVGADAQLEVTATPASPISWQSGDSAVVSVEQDGYIRARGVGSATITASVPGASLSIEVNVVEYVPMTTLLATEAIKIRAGKTRQLVYQTFPPHASDSTLTFAVTPDDGKVQVDRTGHLSVSVDAAPGSEYTVTALNQRSGVSAQTRVFISDQTKSVAWTLGDSIFEFNQSAVCSMLTELGYGRIYTDNIAGQTVVCDGHSGKDLSCRIESQYYEDWEEPDLVLVQRATNDCYYWDKTAHMTMAKSQEAVERTCEYLRNLWPQARIVWATPIWRADVAPDKLEQMRSFIQESARRHGIEVFMLHEYGAFASLDVDGYTSLLYDGIHPNASGLAEMLKGYKAHLQ